MAYLVTAPYILILDVKEFNTSHIQNRASVKTFCTRSIWPEYKLFINNFYTIIFVAFAFVAPLFWIIIVNIFIYRELGRLAIHHHENSLTLMDKETDIAKNRLIAELNTIVGVFFFTQMPYYTYLLMMQFSTIVIPWQLNEVIRFCLTISSYSTPALNVIIYTCFNPHFRRAVFRLCGKNRLKQSIQ